MKKKPSITKTMDWTDIIVHCVNLREKEEIAAKDLVEYFHFKYLTELGLERWTMPQYKTQTKSAEKLLREYGGKFSIIIIDILFDNYKTILRKDFAQIIWSLGLLSSDNAGWIMTAVLTEYNNLKSQDTQSIVKRLLSKPRSTWTIEERQLFESSIN